MTEPGGDPRVPARGPGFSDLGPSELPHWPLGFDISNEKELTLVTIVYPFQVESRS